jgi:hypothetical protein
VMDGAGWVLDGRWVMGAHLGWRVAFPGCPWHAWFPLASIAALHGSLAHAARPALASHPGFNGINGRENLI